MLLPYRCDDNACVASPDLCSDRNTCMNDDEHRCRYGRNVGMCYSGEDCADDSICPKDTPVLYVFIDVIKNRCPNGDCVNFISQCRLQEYTCDESRREKND